MIMHKVSVIIPVYGVDRFIRRCTESLFNQTLKEVEYIFVNDCTKDGSMDILRDVINAFPDRAEQLTIVEHETNKGLAGARNTGLAKARGEYVFHCDSDDFVEATMLEKMYSAAKSADADMASTVTFSSPLKRTKDIWAIRIMAQAKNCFARAFSAATPNTMSGTSSCVVQCIWITACHSLRDTIWERI